MPVITNPDFESDKITIGFHYIDPLGNTYNSESTLTVFFDCGENELSVIGRQLNSFLKQCGYYRSRDTVLMDDLTEEEADALVCYLSELRRKETAGED